MMREPRSICKFYEEKGSCVYFESIARTCNEVLSTQSSLPYAFEIVFKPHPQSKARKHSAFTLIKWLLAKKNKRGILSSHRRQLLNVLLFKITEAESSKYKTRFQSQGALVLKTKLRHDHVYQRSKMIEVLEKAAPRKVDKILKKSVGCTVTSKEHDRLREFDKQYDGWNRYRKAKIKVIDTAKDLTRRKKRRVKRKPRRKK